ncbi:Cellulase (glycosyl hydrolase family 5) [Quadrisphaera granulorum]|uniref:mannan endo-1,4-beta-mannosidase n=1 Tax=Quadrisphaera granulorum TaxID=317664 RepID=A0A315ZL98_9ACTN|nr:cellulase family glycosylhydrolase [Quadrisphaera granulorum]PWJ46276.1 cellulase (glycosyl hydrolase family 5) [Quadrisphaera granulorum]SZE99091.1 Cellulase (glycosyl hydrolase family 5) [Quadrisphaera granulorum]
MALSLITRAGDTLQDGRGTWRARGANVWDLLDSSPQEAAQRLTEVAALGVNAVRTWAFSKDGRADGNLLQRLDAALAVADRLGIRLLLCLGNGQTDFGGPQCFKLDQDSWYRPGGDGIAPEWAAQVQALVSRYRGRGAVMAWEVLNEPRPNFDPISMGWIDRAAKLVKATDPTHLVSSGAEGFLHPLYPTPDAQSGASVDLSVANLHPPSIDLVSSHV